MTNNQNWPYRFYAYTRNWGRSDTAGRFMGFINVELSRKEDLPPNFPAVEYISADKVREIQLATIKATLEAVLPKYTTMWKRDINYFNPESIIEQVNI
jgi:hypothetical protein